MSTVLSPAQVQMRTIYRALRRAGAVGMVRAELVKATGMPLWRVRELATKMAANCWVYEVPQVVAGRKVYRYATCREHWNTRS